MGNPEFLAIENDLIVKSWSNLDLSSVRIKFHQQTTGMLQYRLKCVPIPNFTPQSFPYDELYINFSSIQTSPQYIYTQDFLVTSIKDKHGSNTSMKTIFSYCADTDVIKLRAYLQSSTQPGSDSFVTSTEQRELVIRLADDGFGPTWECPTWLDTKYSEVVGIRTLSGSDQKGVQGVSRIQFTANKATVNAGADIASYSVAVTGGPTMKQDPRKMGYPAHHTFICDLDNYKKLVGRVSVVFTVEDIRGRTTTFTRTITIVPYTMLTMVKNDTHRQGGTGQTVILDFEGRWHGSPLTLTCEGIVAKEQGSSTVFAELHPTIDGSSSSFSYNSEWTGVSFDRQKAYTIEVTFTDTLKTVTLRLPIPVGTPVLSIRDKKVGVNNPSPNCALDVTGIIQQNGYRVFSFISTIPGNDVHNCTETGFYLSTSAILDNYPTTETAPNCMVLVWSVGSYLVLFLYDLSTNDLYICRRVGSVWSVWKKATLT